MRHDCDVHIQAGSWVTSVGSGPQYPRGDLQELAAVSVSLSFCKLSSSAQLSARLPILEMLKRGDSQLGHLALSCCFLVSKKLESGVYTKSAIWLKVHESRHLGRQPLCRSVIHSLRAICMSINAFFEPFTHTIAYILWMCIQVWCVSLCISRSEVTVLLQDNNRRSKKPLGPMLIFYSFCL